MTGSLARFVKRLRGRLWIGDETSKEKPMKPDSKCPAEIPNAPHAEDCSDRVVFILPRLPPAHCGLGDYSMILLEHMAMTTPPKILVMHGAAETHAAHPDLDVEPLPTSCGRLLQRLRDLKARRVFVQYVAQGFQSRGCPLWFLAALRKWRVETPAARLVIMFQELWFEPAWWKPDWLLQKFHRFALRKLVGVVDQTFVSTETFGKWLVGATPPDRVRILVNPATIPLVGSLDDARREQGCFVLFGRQGSRIFALQDMAPWLGRLHSAGLLKRLQLVGSRETEAMNAKEDHLARTLLPEGLVEIVGPQTDERISKLFMSAEAGIFTKTARDYTKSTIFMGCASHGLSIVSHKIVEDARAPLCWVTSAADLLDGAVAPPELRARGEQLAWWYEENASWARVAGAYREALGLT